ncbi:MAG: hypothetical protein LUF04_16160 [Bacteroides sp.]|nr:hypothetical protein [Bacteroides sp.]
MQVTALNNQSLLDIAVQEFGTLEAVYDLAERNDLAITSDLEPGQALDYHPDGVDSKIVAYLAANGVRPATAITENDRKLVPYGGMGYMGIEIDFRMS